MTGYRADIIPVFAGPSLADWTAKPPFVRLPPAGAGDMLRLLAGPTCTVVLVDGVFDVRPAVWHKEILVLLAHGFRVIGAASMGALRAAELAPFGMIGCGAVFRAYEDGRITGDDEVAVLHAPAALGGAGLSLAQVNVRAALCAGVRQRRLTLADARRIRAASAAIHYKDRTWAAVAGLPGAADFAAFAARGSPDIKAADARQALALALCLAPMAAVPTAAPPHTPSLDRLAAAGAVDPG